MILLLTNKEDITADFVVLELKKRGVDFFRFNTEDFPEFVDAQIEIKNNKLLGRIIFKKMGIAIPLTSIKSVWYRRPQYAEFLSIPKRFREFCTRECFWFLDGIFQNLQTFWVSHPYNIRIAENKITQLKVASSIGFLVPKTIVSNEYEEIMNFWYNCKGKIVIKPVKVGLIGENHLLFTNKIRKNDIKVLKNTKSVIVPSIYQEYIPKKYDIRITVVGNKIFPVEIHSQHYKESKIDWRKPENVYLPHKKHVLPKEVAYKCLKLLQIFGLQFGTIDMILTADGKYYFLEINPNGQWAWIERRTGYKLTKTLVDLLLKGEENGDS